MSKPVNQFRLLAGFDDRSITPHLWNDLLARGSSDVIFMTWHWQKAWWESFGRGKLLLIAAERDGKMVAITPLFEDQGMIYFIGSGGSDYLDLVGEVTDSKFLEEMLLFAVENANEFLGFCFYHILESSSSPRFLTEIAKRQGWDFFYEGEHPSPMLELGNYSEQHLAARKKSMLRRENWFERNGGLKIEHLTEGREIFPHLDYFFEQHIKRWQKTPFPSLFEDHSQRFFFKKLCAALSETGWLRFTRVIWKEQTISYHFGFNYKGSFFWYKPSFDISLSKHSPGEVLLRHLILQAQKEQAHTFDFGLGDEAFKNRFATSTRFVKNWGLYPLR